jgi:hypothetical protein
MRTALTRLPDLSESNGYSEKRDDRHCFRRWRFTIGSAPQSVLSNTLRSMGVAVAIGVAAVHQDSCNETLAEQTHALEASAHGSAIFMKNAVEVGQTGTLVYMQTCEKAVCRVARARLII